MRIFRLDDDHPLTGWHMLGIVGAFFGTIIGVNVVMAFAATGTFPGLVVANSYVASQNYDALLAKARAQEAAGWRHELAVRDGVLRFRLATAAGTPAFGLTVSAHVGRPSTARDDWTLAFANTGGGEFVSLERLAAGRWEVDVEAHRGADLVFRITQEIFLRPEAR
jgi:nitrogen fixation protein FixH